MTDKRKTFHGETPKTSHMGSVDIRYRGKPKMTIRDKIADIIQEGDLLLSYQAYQEIADAIIAALPDYEAQQTRITELEAVLLRAEDTIKKSWVIIYPDMEEEFNMDGSWHVVQDIRAALKGEET